MKKQPEAASRSYEVSWQVEASNLLKRSYKSLFLSQSFLTGEKLTLIGAVCVGLVAVVPTVVISIAGPVIWDAASAVTLELSDGAGVTAACLVAVVPAVVI